MKLSEVFIPPSMDACYLYLNVCFEREYTSTFSEEIELEELKAHLNE